MDRIETCIIPAAGKGTRWAPVTGYLPKEMLPLVDKPVIHWVIEEVKKSGIKNVVVVINKSKEAIKKYLDSQERLLKNSKIKYVYQETPNGVAEAIYLCKKYVDKNRFCVALPDLPTISRKPVMKQLVSASNLNIDSHVVSFDNFPKETLSSYGECKLKIINSNSYKVVHFCPRTKKLHHPKIKVRMSGRFIFTKDIFDVIEYLLRKRISGEVTDQDALKTALTGGQKVMGVKIQGRTYDTGSPKTYVRANTAYFKKHIAS